MLDKFYRFCTNPNSRYNVKRKLLDKTFRRKIVLRMRKQIKNKDFSIISSDCIGGLFYHDLKMEFLSPTINMAIPARSFVLLCTRLARYMDIDPVQIELDNSYPIMKIDDVIVNGIHYYSYDELKEKWEERKKRINYENLYMIFTAKDGFDESLLPLIDRIPGNKILFSHKPYRYDWCCYLPEFSGAEKVGDLTRYVGIFGYKYYDKHFDMIKWVNGSPAAECIRKNKRKK